VEPSYPTLTRRYVSSLIDGLLLIAMLIVGALLLQGEGLATARVAVFIFVFLAYEPLLTSQGLTLGQYLTGIRVRRLDDVTRRIPLYAAYIRYLVKIPLGFVSFLTMSFNERQRAIHDFAAGSVVVMSTARSA
jgi:uncharacterized RDD family membrane protein YckC